MITFIVKGHYGDPPAHVTKEAFNPVVVSIFLWSDIMLGATTSGLVSIKSTSLKSIVYSILIPLPRLLECFPTSSANWRKQGTSTSLGTRNRYVAVFAV